MPPTPIYLTELFPLLDQRLIELLRSLSAADWQRPTVCRGWSVKDITAHLLDGNFRRIALNRDGYESPEQPVIESYQDLVDHLNQLNAEWVRATRRLSPNLLIDLLEQSGKQVYEAFCQLLPHDTATFSVGWAGEETSENWFDIAREYTERWHHQQQIRLAVDRPGDLLSQSFHYPLLDTFMRALPHTYRHTPAPTGSVIQVTVSGEGGGVWQLVRQSDAWLLTGQSCELVPTASVSIDEQIAWRLFTKGIGRLDALPYLHFGGDRRLAEKILDMIAVMG